VYCSKCGGVMADGAAFCSNCGQAFAVTATRAPMMNASAAVPMGAGGAAVPAYAGYAAVPRVEYAGFWLRFLAWLIDNVVMGVGVVLILIPLIFLTSLRTVLDDFHPSEDMNDANAFMLIGFVFVLATASLVVTWLYHALMESSEWQATLGKKALGLVVTDLAGQRVSFGRATGRHFAKIVTNLASFGIGLGYLMAAFTEKKQALHDMLAGCLVLQRDR
jgi:uncharacterized RDD family membrane protein YckC